MVVFWRQQSVLRSHHLISPPLLFYLPPFFAVRTYVSLRSWWSFPIQLPHLLLFMSVGPFTRRGARQEIKTFKVVFFSVSFSIFTLVFMFFPPVSLNVRELLMSLTADRVVSKLRQLWQKQTVKNNTLKKHFWECEWIINTVPRWHWARHFSHMQLTPQGRFRIKFKPDSSSSDKSLFVVSADWSRAHRTSTAPETRIFPAGVDFEVKVCASYQKLKTTFVTELNTEHRRRHGVKSGPSKLRLLSCCC